MIKQKYDKTEVKMKKTLLSISMALLLSASTYADPVTPSQALALAQQFVAHGMQGTQGKANAKRAIASQPKLKLAYTATDSRLYAFNRGTQEGYVIVSGDDATAPVIGYSDHGSFDPDHMPEPMKEWLARCERQIAYAATTGAKYSAAASTQAADGQDWAVIEPLLKTHWSQGDPYNGLTPLKDVTEDVKKHALTGCVATAMAQVFNYFQYPAQAKGKGYKGRKDLSQYTFDWANMATEYTDQDETPLTTTTEAQRQAVAQLMVAAGYSVDMTFTLKESSSNQCMVPFAAVQNFSYDRGTHVLPDFCYDPDTWKRMVYDNLATCGPLVYGGMGENGGHSFVCDGYAGNGYFHFNWGWSGNADGNFLLTLLNPTVHRGDQERTYDFTADQEVVFGLRRPVEGSKPIYNMLYLNPSPMLTKDGENLVGEMQFLTCEPVTYEFGLKLTDVATGQTAIYASGEKELTTALNGSQKTVPIKVSAPDGEYIATPVFRVKGEEAYQPFLFRPGAIQSMRLKMAGGKQTCYSMEPYKLTEKAWGNVAGEKLFANQTNTVGILLHTNGGEHTVDLHVQVIDEQSQEVVCECAHQQVPVDLSLMNQNVDYPIEVGQLDTSHTYMVKIFDGDEEIGCRKGLKAEVKPMAEIVEPLSSPQVVDGKIWRDVDGFRLRLKVRNLSNMPIKICKVVERVFLENGEEISNGTFNIEKLSEQQDGIVEVDEEVPVMPLNEQDDGLPVKVKFEVIFWDENGSAFDFTDGKDPEFSASIVDYDPTTAIAQVTANPGAKAISQLSLYTADGKLVKTLQGQTAKAYKGQASLQSLPSGIYIVRTVYADGSVEHTKVVKK